MNDVSFQWLVHVVFSLGWLFDMTDTYHVTFLVCGGLGVVGGVLYLLMMPTDKAQRSKDRQKDDATPKDGSA